MSDAVALFHLPALKKLQLTRLGKPKRNPDHVGLLRGLPSTSSVEDLTLCQSPAELLDLAEIVNCCRSLKVFVYIFEDWTRPAPADYLDLAKALASTSTLEKLYIYDDRMGGALPSLVDDLARMVTVKQITLPLATFRLAHAPEEGRLLNLNLPRNVEELRLNNIRKDEPDLLLEVLRQVIVSG